MLSASDAGVALYSYAFLTLSRPQIGLLSAAQRGRGRDR
jgi:hypothetical protein